MEPSCEPQRIRVPDRVQVTLHVTNLSPTEYCSPTASAPSPTAVTNPLESIINTITGLKSFNLVQKTPFTPQMDTIEDLIVPDKTKNLVTEAEKNPPKDPTAVLFQKLAKQVLPAAQKIADKQSHWQDLFLADLTKLQDYQSGDYRGANWSKFDPEHDATLDVVRSHKAFPTITNDPGSLDSTPSEMDFAPLQALIDQLKALQPLLISACTTATAGNGKKKCNPEVLSTTSLVIEKAGSYLTVATDNVHTLQATQTGIVAAYNALLAQRHLFDVRRAAGSIQLSNGVLQQNIPLGTNYSSTASGSVSCATTATPPVVTTDAIAVSILYQNIPTLTASAGILVSFIQQNQYGVVQQMNTATSTSFSAIGMTNSARAGVVPMAFFNFRLGGPRLTTWYREPNNELIITQNLSAGLGLNSNSGSNQAEFFGGYAVGFSRVLIHAGLDYGRSQALAPGFSTGALPTGFTGSAVPVTWSYHPGFTIGFSVRVAPF
jgi:hypothetical protein